MIKLIVNTNSKAINCFYKQKMWHNSIGWMKISRDLFSYFVILYIQLTL